MSGGSGSVTFILGELAFEALDLDAYPRDEVTWKVVGISRLNRVTATRERAVFLLGLAEARGSQRGGREGWDQPGSYARACRGAAKKIAAALSKAGA